MWAFVKLMFKGDVKMDLHVNSPSDKGHLVLRAGKECQEYGALTNRSYRYEARPIYEAAPLAPATAR